MFKPAMTLSKVQLPFQPWPVCCV